MKQNHPVEVRKVRGMGRGVFATKSFKVDDVIEVCPVILFPHSEKTKRDHDTYGYSFRWNKNNVAISLGFGSLYNHSYEPNAVVVQDLKALTMTIHALRPISAGEQLFINYNGPADDKSPLWFT